eukprot:CAMPEP_0183714754 /NCGR_PEP_ID=MMETSP0737-20130205/9210_1 /TAXON_ID=385413 /ORGANISM="Thalassiosira miniscula, Strain CCMP1093" /LENGTH=483 /DNA_ID=CAMNT_0025943755 /DNA_START=175 /DNA_END=1626 /DNA_ORIENTATION=+
MTSDTLQTIAGVLGNVLEWYDFAIYGFFSDTLAQVFFPPHQNGHDNLVYSYLVFGGAFVMRPMGGIITGHIGDKHGRKRALVFSLSCMAVPTVAMGLLPTYDQVGGWSTALLVLCRLLQGFSVGGQLPSSVVYILEARPKEHWGYYGSFIAFANGLGAILGNLVGALLRTLLTDDQLVQWGWRVAFFTGTAIVPAVAFLQIYGGESNPNEGRFGDTAGEVEEEGGRRRQEAGGGEDQQGHGEEEEEAMLSSSRLSTSIQNNPLAQSLKRDNWIALLTSFLTPMLGGAGFYLTFVWMAVYMTTLISNPISNAFWINLLASICGFKVTTIAAGYLSDRIGRNLVMSVGAVSVAIFAPIFLWIISWGKPVDAFFAQWALGVLLSLFTGPLFAWMTEQFPPKVRLTSAALGYNLGICLSSGFTPAIATALVRDFGPVAPGAIYPFFAILALIGMYLSTKIDRRGDKEQTIAALDEDDSKAQPLLEIS